ncbi:hypothetical protein [Chitinophaga silvatica]|nr:hypothetical protein [Chitinophaga silvatica]
MEEERKESYPSLGVHQYLIKRLTIELIDCGIDWERFNEEVGELKRLRILSDYQERPVDRNKSQRSLHLSNSITNYLITNFIL